MSGIEHTQSDAARGLHHLRDARRDFLSALQLTDDADLHVIDQQRQFRAVANILQGLRHGDAKSLFHAVPCFAALPHPITTEPAGIGHRFNRRIRAEERQRDRPRRG
jgi:hypothetical protein